MVKLRRIGLISAGRFGFLLGFATIFTQLLVLLFFLATNGIPPTSLPAEFWWEVGGIMLRFAGISALSIFIFASIFNWSSDLFGGLELEIEMPVARNDADMADED